MPLSSRVFQTLVDQQEAGLRLDPAMMFPSGGFPGTLDMGVGSVTRTKAANLGRVDCPTSSVCTSAVASWSGSRVWSMMGRRSETAMGLLVPALAERARSGDVMWCDVVCNDRCADAAGERDEEW